MVDYMKHLVETMVQTHKEAKPDDSHAYQKALQKLEAEVRTHIQVTVTQIEEQLKLYLDDVEAKLEKVERQRDRQLQEAEARIKRLERENSDLNLNWAQENRRPNLPVKGEEVDQLKKQVSQAQQLVKDLQAKARNQEAKITQLVSRPDSAFVDRNIERELESMRKKYDDKCSEMIGLVKRINSLAATKSKPTSAHQLKESKTVDARDVSPVPSTTGLKHKMRSYKALHTVDSQPTLLRQSIERSKSTERLQSKNTRAPSRIRGALSSTVKVREM